MNPNKYMNPIQNPAAVNAYGHYNDFYYVPSHETTLGTLWSISCKKCGYSGYDAEWSKMKADQVKRYIGTLSGGYYETVIVGQNWAKASIYAVSRSPGSIDIFYVHYNGVIPTVHGSNVGGYGSPSLSYGHVQKLPLEHYFLGGAPVPADSKVTAISRCTGQIDGFFTGNDMQVKTFSQSPESAFYEGWSDAVAIGGDFPPGSPVTVVSNHENRLDAFVTGSYNDICWSWWPDDPWWSGLSKGWRSLGQPPGGVPQKAPVTAIIRKPGVIDLFVVANDGHVYTNACEGFEANEGSMWMGWCDIGYTGSVVFAPGTKLPWFEPGSPVSVVSQKERLDVFIVGSHNLVFTSHWPADTWWSGLSPHRWDSLGSPGPIAPGSPVTIVENADNLGHYNLIVRDNNGAVFRSEWSSDKVTKLWAPFGGF